MAASNTRDGAEPSLHANWRCIVAAFAQRQEPVNLQIVKGGDDGDGIASSATRLAFPVSGRGRIHNLSHHLSALLLALLLALICWLGVVRRIRPHGQLGSAPTLPRQAGTATRDERCLRGHPTPPPPLLPSSVITAASHGSQCHQLTAPVFRQCKVGCAVLTNGATKKNMFRSSPWISEAVPLRVARQYRKQLRGEFARRDGQKR